MSAWGSVRVTNSAFIFNNPLIKAVLLDMPLMFYKVPQAASR